jgi:hypothetical protein
MNPGASGALDQHLTTTNELSPAKLAWDAFLMEAACDDSSNAQ